MKIIFNPLSSLFFIFLSSILAFLLFLIATDPGLRMSFNLVNSFSGNAMKVEKLEGRLISLIKAKNLSYDKNEQHIVIKKIEFNWQPWKLLKGTLLISTLHAEDVKIQHPGISLHVSNYWLNHFVLHDVVLQRVTLINDHFIKPLHIDTLYLDADQRTHQYAINLDASLGNNHLSLDGQYKKNWNLTWNANFPRLFDLSKKIQGSLKSQGKIDVDSSGFAFQQETSLKDIHYDAWLIKQLISKGRGTDKNHELSFFYDNNQLELNALLQGLYSQNHWMGTIKKLVLHENEQTYLTELTGSHLVLDHVNKNLFARLNTPSKKLPALMVHVEFPNITFEKLLNGSQTLTGKMELNDPELQLTKLLSFMPKMNGQMKMKLDLSGSLNSPDIFGTAELKNGEMELKNQGVLIKNINLTVTRPVKGNAIIKGSMQSDKGKINITGNTHFPFKNSLTDITIKGENFTFLNTQEYKATASPDLNLTWQDSKLLIKGQIKIPEASIFPKTTESSTELPKDVVFTDVKKPVATKTQLPFQVISDINVILGDKVDIDIEGISGKLHGSVKIHDQNGEKTTGEGEFYITDGKYQAYGQQMVIREGRLIFSGGPVDIPGIRLIAFRTINLDPNRLDTYECRNITSNPQFSKFYETTLIKINVGIHVTGQIDDRQVSLIAEPNAFTQADMLSLLVLGEPLCLVNQGQSQSLISALSAMNMSVSRITQLQQQIAKAFGLSELTFTSVAEKGAPRKTQTALLLGKALTPKIYVSYLFNVVSSEQIVRVRYRISKKWQIQSEQSRSGTAVYILYTFERK